MTEIQFLEVLSSMGVMLTPLYYSTYRLNREMGEVKAKMAERWKDEK